MSLNDLIQAYQELCPEEQKRFRHLIGASLEDTGPTPEQMEILGRRIEECEGDRTQLLEGEEALREIADKHDLSLPATS